MSQATSILGIGLFVFIFLWIISCLNLYDTSGLILHNYNIFIFTSIISFLILILVILKIDTELKLFQTINYLHVLGIVLLLYIFFSINISTTLFSIAFILFIGILILSNYKELFSLILWFKHELLYKYLTTNYIDIFIVLLTIIVCLGYFFGRDGLNYAILPYYNTIINKPLYLNNLQTYTIPINNHYNYSISTWIYINPQPLNTNVNYNKYTSLLNYQNKPEIVYKGKGNNVLIKMLDGKTKRVITFQTNKLKLQSWNHFVINYYNSIVDVFLNNELVGSKSNIVPYINKSDQITTGYKDGIHGGIKYLQVFRKRLNNTQINYLYNYQK